MYSFGAMVALAFLAATWWGMHRAKQLGENPDTLLELGCWMVFSGLVGARLFYVIFFPAAFFADPIGVLFNQGGLVWYGGMIAVTLTMIWFAQAKKISLWRLMDIMAPPAALGLAIGRIGCLLAGCCYGGLSTLPWTIQYPVGHETHPHFVHPSPLYETIALLIVTALLGWMDRHKKFEGLTGWSFFVLYGIVRFVLEYYRGDRLVWIDMLNLSASQVISLAGVLLGSVMIWQRHQQSSISKIN